MRFEVLGELLDCVIDHRGKTPRKLGGDFTDHGVPVLSAKNIKDGRLLGEGDLRCVNEEMFRRWMKVPLEKNDILLTSEAPLGETFWFKKDVRYVLGQRLFALRAKTQELHPGYLYYYLKTKEGQAQLNNRASGSTVQGISQSELLKVEVRLPDRYEHQEDIVDALGKLDDKIENNRKTAATLEEMARALYRSWFVDFDPVHAKAAGEKPAFMDEETAALFPDRFADDGLPEGWEIAPLSQICEHVKQTVKPMEAPDNPFLHFSLPAFDIDKLPIAELGREIKSNKTLVPHNTILFSRLNPSIPRVWWARTKGLDATPASSTEFFIARAHDPSEAAWLYCMLSSEEFRDAACSRVTGTSNSHQRVPPKALLEIPVTSPTTSVVSAFGKLASPWFEKIHIMATENQTLATLRDTLLPKLMSGEIRVGEAREQVEELT